MDGSDISWDMIKSTLRSVAGTCVFAMQDALALGAEARMNVPGVDKGNWSWRMDRMPGPALAQRIRQQLLVTNRLPKAPVPIRPLGNTAELDNFTRKIHKDPSKDKIVYFHAPWCRFCQEFTPKLEAVAEEMGARAGLAFYEMDIDRNTKESLFPVEGVPALYMLPAGRLTPIRYG